MTDNDLMPWGKKHKGKKMSEIPAQYKLWCLEELSAPGAYMVGYRDLYRYLKDNEDALRKEAKGK